VGALNSSGKREGAFPDRGPTHLVGNLNSTQESPAPDHNHLGHLQAESSTLSLNPKARSQPADPSRKYYAPGTLIGSTYEIMACLGEGATGVVYRVRNRQTDSLEALKIPPPNLLGTQHALDMFVHEARVAEKLRHPYLVPIHKVGMLPETQQVYFTMALMDGGDLGKVLERSILENRPIPIQDVVRWMQQVAEALAYLHGEGLVHQDLKPANILLNSKNDVCLGDFGLAFMPQDETVRDHLRQSTLVGGTTYFMSPEQHQAIFYRKKVAITQASDVCAFGLTLYNLISGEIIAGSREPIEEFVDDPDLAQALDEFLDQCLARKPEKRFTNGRDLMYAFRRVATLAPQTSQGTPKPQTGLLGKLRASVFGDALVPGSRRRFFVTKGCEWVTVWVPPGRFIMGSPPDEVGRFEDELPHQVTLSSGFWMMETLVTQQQWIAVMGSNPSYNKGKSHPVDMVSWQDVQAFLERCRSLNPNLILKLPTEAQWEYACRAGGETTLNLDAVAWHSGNSRGSSHRVKSKKPNAWKLYDLQGNLWEWCSDYYDAFTNQPATDPKGPRRGTHRVLRGGSFDYAAKYGRPAARFRYHPENTNINIGFRLNVLP